MVTLAGVISAGCQAWLPSGATGGVSTMVHTEPSGTWSVTTTGAAPAVVDQVSGAGVTSAPSRVQENVPLNTVVGIDARRPGRPRSCRR